MTETNSPSGLPASLVHTPQEAATLLHIGKNTLHALLRSGRLRSVRVGRKYLIPSSAIQEFLEGRSTT
ncbi:helix-turn-helix domain-containing protein [Deinobacterium chartae]|uniref:helix-turn-helix domain-containing protein n=1 Tax=Deinobacterium chartae TaxID=521158 RepID=UPI001619E2A3|nr:helix-turn-helix domain-containing protein [Deinobacterium chartae]